MSGFVEYVQHVGLIDKAAFALRRRRNSEKGTTVAIINRALQLYDAVQVEVEKGHELMVRDQAGRVAVITFTLGAPDA